VLNIPALLADIDAQNARTQQAAIAYEKAVQTAYGEAENAMVQLAADQRRVALLTDGEARARRVERLVEAAEPVASYPGELPMLLQEAQRVAENSGFSIVDLARELQWKPVHVRAMLGMLDPRPTLSLVRGAETS
jgi:histidine ammonia-lyase